MSLTISHAHAESREDCLRTLDTPTEGLAPDEAARRRAEYGPNLLPQPSQRPAIIRFLLHFHNVLMYVLIGGATVTAALGHMIDTWVILAVVLVNAVMGFIQEGRAENAMAAIRQMLAPHASVLRAGRRSGIEAGDLVPGDIVLLEPGDRVAADLRLLEVHGLHVQEAILTGESLPVEKATAPVAAEAPLGDRTPMAFSGTLVTSGTGRGVVVATGAVTEVGRISGMLGGVEALRTPLVVQMDRFARWLTVLILLTSGGLLAFGHYVRHIEFETMFMSVVSLAVAAIPEALPAVMTITLAVGVRTMAKRNAIVRRLPAIETIGAVSVICTDKTGTLTQLAADEGEEGLHVTGVDIALEAANARLAVLHGGDAPCRPQRALREHRQARAATRADAGARLALAATDRRHVDGQQQRGEARVRNAREQVAANVVVARRVELVPAHPVAQGPHEVEIFAGGGAQRIGEAVRGRRLPENALDARPNEPGHADRRHTERDRVVGAEQLGGRVGCKLAAHEARHHRDPLERVDVGLRAHVASGAAVEKLPREVGNAALRPAGEVGDGRKAAGEIIGHCIAWRVMDSGDANRPHPASVPTREVWRLPAGAVSGRLFATQGGQLFATQETHQPLAATTLPGKMPQGPHSAPSSPV